MPVLDPRVPIRVRCLTIGKGGFFRSAWAVGANAGTSRGSQENPSPASAPRACRQDKAGQQLTPEQGQGDGARSVVGRS